MITQMIRRAPLGAALIALNLAPSAWAAQDTVKISGDLGFDDKSISQFVRQHSAGNVNPLRLDKAQLAKRDFLYGFGNWFRLIAATDSTRLRRTFAPRDKATLAQLLDTKANRDAPGIWRYFFRSSLIYVGLLESPVVRIGFYNPIVDGWVMTNWSWRGREIKLADVQVVSGEAMRGDKVTDATHVAWVARKQGSLTGNIRDTTGIAGFAFARAHLMLGIQPPRFRRSPKTDHSRAVVESRLVGMLANLNQHYRSAPMTAASENLVKAVATGDTAALAPLTASVAPLSLHRIDGQRLVEQVERL